MTNYDCYCEAAERARVRRRGFLITLALSTAFLLAAALLAGCVSAPPVAVEPGVLRYQVPVFDYEQ